MPEPEAPIIASTSPWRTGRLTSRTTQFSPYASQTDSMRMRSLTRGAAGRAARRREGPATGAVPLSPALSFGAATLGSRSIAIRRTGGGISGSTALPRAG